MSDKFYQRLWVLNKRKKAMRQELINQGKCPECGIILSLAPNHDCSKYDWKILDA